MSRHSRNRAARHFREQAPARRHGRHGKDSGEGNSRSKSSSKSTSRAGSGGHDG